MGVPLRGFLYSVIDGRFPLQGRRKNASERHVKAGGLWDIHLFYHDFYRNWTKSNSLWAEHEVNAAVGFHLST